MRTLIPWAAASTLLAAFAVLPSATPAHAGELATRCGAFGCDQIHCNFTGDRCVRYSDYDSYYNGYVNGYIRNVGYYGGYDGGYGPYENGYYGGYEGGYSPYENGYYGGYGPYDNGNFGGYSPYYGGNYGSGYYGGYGPSDSGYYGGYYGGYDGWHLVCDSDGDRCYRSLSPFWNFREYYRIHGYHWNDWGHDW